MTLLFNGVQTHIGPWRTNAFSVATKATWITLPVLNLCLDMGWCVEPMRHIGRLFLSHMHQDHSHGVPIWLGWRQEFIARDGAPTIFLPAECVDDARAWLDASGRAQHCEATYELVGLSCGDEVELDGRHVLRAFRTTHNVPTLGARIYRRVRTLRADARGLSQQQLHASAKHDPSIFEDTLRLELAYTSDTTPEVFARHPELLDARTLITECSFIDGVDLWRPDDTSTEGEVPHLTHTHLRPLGRALRGFRGKHLALNHMPLRHTREELHAYITPRLPPELRDRLIILPYR